MTLTIRTFKTVYIKKFVFLCVCLSHFVSNSFFTFCKLFDIELYWVDLAFLNWKLILAVGEKCPRIPEVSSLPLEGVDLENENGPGGAPKTAPAILLSNHMVRYSGFLVYCIYGTWTNTLKKNQHFLWLFLFRLCNY